MDEFDIIEQHGLKDGKDHMRMEQALKAAKELTDESLEDIFLTFVSLEKKGLLSFDLGIYVKHAQIQSIH